MSPLYKIPYSGLSFIYFTNNVSLSVTKRIGTTYLYFKSTCHLKVYKSKSLLLQRPNIKTLKIDSFSLRISVQWRSHSTPTWEACHSSFCGTQVIAVSVLYTWLQTRDQVFKELFFCVYINLVPLGNPSVTIAIASTLPQRRNWFVSPGCQEDKNMPFWCQMRSGRFPNMLRGEIMKMNRAMERGSLVYEVKQKTLINTNHSWFLKAKIYMWVLVPKMDFIF